MWTIRAIVSAVTAAGVAAGAGRAIINRRIDRQADEVIARGVDDARQRVRAGASVFLTDAWRNYAISCAIKLICLGVILGLTFAGLVPRTVAAGLVGFFLLASIAYDIFARRDLIRSAIKHIREHGLRPRKIVRNLIAREVLKEVMESIATAQPNLTNKILFALGGRDRDALEHKVALAVSETASSFAWDDIRPFLKTAALRLAGLMTVYSGFVAAIVYVLNTSTSI